MRFRSLCRAPARDREQKRPFLFPAGDSSFQVGTLSGVFVPDGRLAKRDGDCVPFDAISTVLEMWINVSIFTYPISVEDEKGLFHL